MMQPERSGTRQDQYREFLEFIRSDLQRERHVVHRKMFSVFFWCFLLPAALSTSLLILIKVGVMPIRTRQYLDWLALIFPVCYSLWVLGFEVLAQVPATFRKGGASGNLGQALKEAEWRERVSAAMSRALPLAPDDWRWMISSFRLDLEAMQQRTRYLTALAGAVFFLLMEGIDTLGGDTEPGVTWTKVPLVGWMETSSNDLSQFVGLALFLVLLYLSGNQTYHSLSRYLHCAELNLLPSTDGRPRA